MYTLLHSVPPTLQQATTQPHLQPETPGHSRASLGQSLVRSLLLSPGSWCAQGLFVPSKSLLPQSCISSVVGLRPPPPRGLMSYPGLLHPEPLHLWQAIDDPYLCRRHSKAGLAQSLWGLLMHTRFCLSLRASLEGMGFDSKHDFIPPTILLGLPLFLWMWCTFFL